MVSLSNPFEREKQSTMIYLLIAILCTYYQVAKPASISPAHETAPDYSSITIRLASSVDLIQIYRLDRAIIEETFRPIWRIGYPELYCEAAIEDDLVEFARRFRTSIAYQENKTKRHMRYMRLDPHWENIHAYVAHEELFDQILGTLLCHYKPVPRDLVIDTVLVHPEHRRHCIGRQLITTALKRAPTTRTCDAYPLGRNNKCSLDFFTALGFVNMGPAPRDTDHPADAASLGDHYQLKIT